jgi:hypothetical protein
MSVIAIRTAVIVGGGSLSQVQAYLPANYTATEDDGTIVIEGTDSAGWTLDDYVIPRLASGLIWARETTAENWPRVLWVCDECFFNSEDRDDFETTRICKHCAGSCDCPEGDTDHHYYGKDR